MSDFIWTFPCYALVAPGPTRLRVASPDGHLAIFTDKHLAEQFAESLEITFSPLACKTSTDLLNLLLSLSSEFETVIVDTNHKTPAGRFFHLQSIVSQLRDQD